MEFEGQYLTYQEYKGLGGTLDLMPFNLLEFRARKEVDKRTSGRLKNLENQVQEVKLCMLDLISKIKSYNSDNNRNMNVSSETIDGYSVSYVSGSIELTQAQKGEVKQIIETYLSECKLEDGTPYLYRG